MTRFIILIGIFLLSLPTYANTNAQATCLQHHCVGIIDAGSTGSRLHIYTYQLDKTNTPIQIKEIETSKRSPAISALDTNTRAFTLYMSKLFTNNLNTRMSVYFYSTGGMRLLPESERSKINHLIKNWFRANNDLRLIAARTISGTEEAVLAWLSVNYRLNLLNQTQKPLVGILDIGGASTQIVAPISDSSSLSKEDITVQKLYGHTIHLFAKSFLGLGQNQIANRYANTVSCYPNEYQLPSGGKGKGDTFLCKEQIAKGLNTTHLVNKTTHTILASHPVDSWYIMGGVTNLLNNKIFSLTQQQFNNYQLSLEANQKICQQNWSDLTKKYKDEYMLFNYCLVPSYLHALIVEGYGFDETKNINFMPQDKSIDWTVGVVLQLH
jgi:apyrase